MKRFMMYLILMAAVLSWPLRCEAEQPGIPVGGISVLMTDINGDPLEGAVFQIVRELKEGELTDSGIEKKLCLVDGEQKIMAVVSFWPEQSMEGQRQTRMVTDPSGSAFVCGLPYGTYYLLETKAPAGYTLIRDPVRITIHKYSHLTEADGIRDDQGVIIDNTLHIVNIRYVLPDTGFSERLRLTAAGIGVLFSVTALILMNRKRYR